MFIRIADKNSTDAQRRKLHIEQGDREHTMCGILYHYDAYDLVNEEEVQDDDIVCPICVAKGLKQLDSRLYDVEPPKPEIDRFDE
jgi:hypothetical protein